MIAVASEEEEKEEDCSLKEAKVRIGDDYWFCATGQLQQVDAIQKCTKQMLLDLNGGSCHKYYFCRKAYFC